MNKINILITGGSGFIGTNLIEKLRSRLDVNLMSLDIASPKIKAHTTFWKKVDIREFEELRTILNEYKPDIVIHLAARTDLNGSTLNDYSTNTVGTQSLVEGLKKVSFNGFCAFTSSMYVCKPGYQPNSDNDYLAHTVYGESKIISENIVKNAALNFSWAILRPTSIWGPWFGIPYIDFFNVVLSRKYLHINGVDTKKTYGYIENTIEQIMSICNNPDKANGKIIYLGDEPAYSIREWANEIAGNVPYKVPSLPYWVLAMLGKIGDFITRAGIKFPMTSFRLSNLMTDNVHDVRFANSLMANKPVRREKANAKTINWLRRPEENLSEIDR